MFVCLNLGYADTNRNYIYIVLNTHIHVYIYSILRICFHIIYLFISIYTYTIPQYNVYHTQYHNTTCIYIYTLIWYNIHTYKMTQRPFVSKQSSSAARRSVALPFSWWRLDATSWAPGTWGTWGIRNEEETMQWQWPPKNRKVTS